MCDTRPLPRGAADTETRSPTRGAKVEAHGWRARGRGIAARVTDAASENVFGGFTFHRHVGFLEVIDIAGLREFIKGEENVKRQTANGADGGGTNDAILLTNPIFALATNHSL